MTRERNLGTFFFVSFQLLQHFVVPFYALDDFCPRKSQSGPLCDGRGKKKWQKNGGGWVGQKTRGAEPLALSLADDSRQMINNNYPAYPTPRSLPSIGRFLVVWNTG